LFGTVWWGDYFALSTPVCSFQFPSIGLKIQRNFLPGFSHKFLHQFPNIINKYHIKPTIFFIQHHLICLHLAVIFSGATVSMEGAQMVLDQHQTFHSRLVDN